MPKQTFKVTKARKQTDPRRAKFLASIPTNDQASIAEIEDAISRAAYAGNYTVMITTRNVAAGHYLLAQGYKVPWATFESTGPGTEGVFTMIVEWYHEEKQPDHLELPAQLEPVSTD